MSRAQRERRSHTRDLALGLAIIVAGAPAAWWASGVFVQQLDAFGRAMGWTS